jgi:DNA invertase Pin-like site-specific DNA recombinase
VVIKKEIVFDMAQARKGRRTAIYARVSTDDKRQDPETQLLQLREYARVRELEVVEEFVDFATGTSEERGSYRRLLEAVRKRQVDVVLVWRYDRFARSTQALLAALKEFQSRGVDFISYQENVDTTTPQGELVFSIMASLAQFESALISERVKAGMARAKSQGKRCSRPRIAPETQAEIERLWREGVSINRISKNLGIAYGTAWNYLKASRD